MHRGQAGDGVLGHVDPGEDGRGLRDAWQPLGEDLGRQVVEVKVDVVLVGADAAPLHDLHRHRAGDDVARREVLGGGRVPVHVDMDVQSASKQLTSVPLHEALSLRVAEDAALAARALRDEAARAVNARGVELHELEVLQRQPRAGDHAAAVARARVRRGGGVPGAAVAAGGEHGVLALEAVQRAVLHVERHHADALAVAVHDEVEREVLDEELRVVAHRLPVERVQDRVPRPVRRARAPIGLASLTKVERLAAEGPLVDLALVRAREGHAVVLELDDGARRLLAHVVDRVLVAQPVAALDRVVHVPPPIVLGHVAERGVDAPLRGDRVRARREQLGDARRLEAKLSESERGAQTRTASAHYDSVVIVVGDFILSVLRLGGRLADRRTGE
eukprot:scaffold37967_cov57-Phaeocystis_antarctica.AAC.4